MADVAGLEPANPCFRDKWLYHLSTRQFVISINSSNKAITSFEGFLKFLSKSLKAASGTCFSIRRFLFLFLQVAKLTLKYTKTYFF